MSHAVVWLSEVNKFRSKLISLRLQFNNDTKTPVMGFSVI